MTIASRTPSLFRPVMSVLTVALFAMTAAGSLRAQKPPKPVPDKEVAEKTAQLKKIAADKKFREDDRGVDLIDALMLKQQAGMIAKDEQLVIKTLDGVMNKGKVRPADKAKLYGAAAEALGRHGSAGAKSLKKAYSNKSRFKAKQMWVPLRERLLRNIGRAKDEKDVKFLLDEANRNPESALQAAAGEALGNFEESKQKVRKQIVKSLLVTFGALSERASQGGTSIDSQNAKDRLAALSGKWTKTLQKLTGQNFVTFREWQTWNNKNKNKKW